MKKALGQTVRDLKRGVNKNVLKVPTIEQKVLDCTSNEPWGPHGTLLADIAQATRNYHEYQMIMSVLWKRTNDTGKNWRHVYKALTVLEYLVAHGAERVIDEIREHAYQIQALSNFQYIDSSGRDQGNNVRKKSQGLVVLVNDKERIQEVREKAASNREKFRNTPAGSMIRPGGYGDKYDDDNYRSRDDDRNGSGRGREYGYRDDDRYEYGRDGDRHGREYEDRYGGDDDSRGRSRSVDNYSSRGRSSNRDKYEDDDHYSSRGSGARADEQTQDGRSIEHKFSEPNLSAPPSYEDAVSGGGSPSHRESYGETPESAPKPSSPPASSSPTQATSKTSPAPSLDIPAVQPMSENGADRFDEFDPRGSYSAASTTSSGAAPTTSVGAEMDLLGSLSDSFTENPLALVPTSGDSTYIVDNLTNTETTFAQMSSPSVPSQGFDDPFGEGPFKAVPSANGAEGQQQQGFNSMSFESGLNQGPDLSQQVSQGAAEGSFFGTTSTPFGESNVQPFSTDAQYQQQEFSTHDSNIDFLADILPLTGSQHNVHPETEYAAPVSQAEPQSGFLTQTGQNMSSETFSSQSNPIALQTDFPAQSIQSSSLSDQHSLHTNFMPQTGDNMSQATFSSQIGPNAQQTSFSAQSGEPTAQTGFPGQLGQLVVHPNFPSQYGQDGFAAHGGQPPSLNGYENQAAQEPQTGSTLQHAFQMNQPQHGGFQGLPGGQTAPPNHLPYGNYIMQSGYGAHVGQTMAPQPSAGSTSLVNASNFSVASQPVLPSTSSVSSTAPPPAKDKQFATKSTVWTDTLSRGLVNLDISGAKTNPLSDIGIDFDALNRREKRMEKPTTTPVTSTIHMGKAMGSGTGIGRAGAGAIRPPPTPMMGTGAGGGMNMGMGGPRPGVGMGGYGGMNQQATGAGMGLNIQPNMGMGRPNIGMGMNMNMGGHMQQPMGMGMNMNMGGQMQQPTGFPPGSNMQGGYNPMMGAGNFGQNPYGGGYRSI